MLSRSDRSGLRPVSSCGTESPPAWGFRTGFRVYVRGRWHSRPMPFNHNDHYHPLLLDLLPPGPGIALDVGCGTGRFARRLAATGRAVEAVDVSPAMVEAAAGLGSPGPGEIVYRQADVTTDPLPEAHYDFISCLASLHHMPFDALARLVGYAGERLNGGAEDGPKAPVVDDFPTMAEMRREAARLLPGSTVRSLLFWRTLIAYREHSEGAPP